MKKIIILLLLAIAGVAAWYIWETRQKPKDEVPQNKVVASKYSSGFNKSLITVLDSYYSLSESFVNWDSVGVDAKSAELRNYLNNIELREIKKDTASVKTSISHLKNYLTQIEENKSLEEKRKVFNTFSQDLFNALRSMEFDNSIVYLQKCPMAFNDTGTGFWISKTEEIRNPYLGMHHPKYKKGMLTCGEIETKIDLANKVSK